MAYECIEFSLSGGIALLTLNRPDKLNCLSTPMLGEIRDALGQVRAPDARVLLLTANGRGFCAGQDLSERKFGPNDPPPDLAASLGQRYNPMIRAIRKLAMPVICAVNGTAAGAGANLALACDIVLAARSATFTQSFAKVGLVQDSGGSWTLPRLVGRARATALALTGETVPAEQAADWGMIWKVVDDDRLAGEAMALALRLAAQPAKGLALIKRALDATWANSLDAQLDLERDLQAIAGRTDDYREAVLAFLEKRAPVFEGK